MSGLRLSELQRAFAIAEKDIRVYYLRPPAVMFGVLFPFTLFLSFTLGRQVSADRLVPMLVAQTVFWASSSIGPTSIPMERRMHTFERYLTAPISLITVLVGKALAGAVFGLFISLVGLFAGLYVFGWTSLNLVALFLGLLLPSLAFSMMGIMFASIPTENPGDVMMPLNFIRIPMMFISGIFIPLEQLPAVAQYAAFVSPLTHALDILRVGLGGTSYFGLLANVAMLVGYTVLFTYMGLLFHRKNMEKE